MDTKETIEIGDRVQHLQYPELTGTVGEMDLPAKPPARPDAAFNVQWDSGGEGSCWTRELKKLKE